MTTDDHEVTEEEGLALLSLGMERDQVIVPMEGGRWQIVPGDFANGIEEGKRQMIQEVEDRMWDAQIPPTFIRPLIARLRESHPGVQG